MEYIGVVMKRLDFEPIRIATSLLIGAGLVNMLDLGESSFGRLGLAFVLAVLVFGLTTLVWTVISSSSPDDPLG